MESVENKVSYTDLFNIKRIIGLWFFALALILACLFLTNRMLHLKGVYAGEPEVVTINAADLLMGFVAGNAPDISGEELEQRARALNADLERIVGEIAARQNLIVVNSASVLAGARDITPLVLQEMRSAGAFGSGPQ